MAKYNVFIQCNRKQHLGALVAKSTIERHFSEPAELAIKIMYAEDTVLSKNDGKEYLRNSTRVKFQMDDLQSFTLLRFWPPELMNYEGKALVIDPDVFALVDIKELFEMDMKGAAVLARKIGATEKHDSYWATSVMLLDCSKLKHWKFNGLVEDLFSFRKDYQDFMMLRGEEQSMIMEISEEWNSYDKLRSETKLLHTTNRLTQPWRTGLPIDFFKYKDKIRTVSSKTWKQTVKEFVKKILVLFKLREKSQTTSQLKPQGVYLPHPDQNQEKFFFLELSHALKKSLITTNELENQINQGNLRKDAFEVLKTYDHENSF